MTEPSCSDAEHWEPLLPSADLTTRAVRSVVWREQRLVLWRDSHGVACVAEDRCPHRNLRISGGYVREDQIVCPHHGWRIGAAGQCFLPGSSPDCAPSALRIRVYMLREAGGVILIRS